MIKPQNGAFLSTRNEGGFPALGRVNIIPVLATLILHCRRIWGAGFGGLLLGHGVFGRGVSVYEFGFYSVVFRMLCRGLFVCNQLYLGCCTLHTEAPGL